MQCYQKPFESGTTIKEVWIIWKGELVRLKRKEIFDGTISRKIQ